MAIIGAGLSGASLAYLLREKINTTLFEKARGVGGRMSTRYADDFQFDHGATGFTARDPEFQNFLAPFIENQTITAWHPSIVSLKPGSPATPSQWQETRYVASPKMNALCKALTQDQPLHLKTQIIALKQHPNGWLLTDANQVDHGPFDWVVSSIPAPQATQLLPTDFSHHASLQTIQMQGCYSLMIGLPTPLDLKWEVAHVDNSPISKIIVNSRKPNRATPYTLLAQTTPEWAEAHLDSDRDALKHQLRLEMENLLGEPLQHATYLALHGWRYASTITSPNAKTPTHFIDHDLKLAACGDWCLQGDVESAFLSVYGFEKRLQSMKND